MTEDEVTAIAERAGKTAAIETLTLIGVDPRDPDDLFRYRQNIEFIAQARTGAQHGLKALASAFLAAIGFAAWLGFQFMIGGKQ